jgi:hypothetical protein
VDRPTSGEFTNFQIVADDRPDDEAIWADSAVEAKAVRKPTAAERFSILLVGGLAIALLIAMVAILIIGAYVSRR